MSTNGRRYEPSKSKLNLKKVLGVIVAFAVVIMIIVSITKLIKTSSKKVEVKTVSYYTSFENGKFGVINNEGNTVINAEYNEIIVIPNSTRPIFLCTYDIDDESGTYKTKAVNENNEEILTGYDKIEAIDNFDSKQNIWYEDNLLRVYKDGKYGLINFSGEEILPCEYEEITALKSVKSNILVKKDGKLGLVNEKGQSIINTEYKNILTLKEGYKNEYIIVDENNKYGLISTVGNILIEPKYDNIKYLNSANMFAVKENKNWKVINTDDSSIVLDEKYDDIIEAKSENIIVKNNDKYGIVSANNEVKIKPQYEDLRFAFSIYYIAKKDGKYGVINLENEEIIAFEYKDIQYIENGGFIIADKTDTETVIFDNNLGKKLSGIISEINTEIGYIKLYTDSEYKYYNFKLEEKNVSDLLTSNTLFLSKKDGKYGYVDKAGNVIVEYNYDDATEENSCGFAAIKKDGVWGSINKAGIIVKEPSVNLDDNLYINFIGEWHLAKSGLYYEK